MRYQIALFLIKLLVRLTTRLEIQGLEGKQNEFQSGGVVIVSNHIGRLDVAFVYDLLNRRDMLVLVAEKYRKSAFWRFIAEALQARFVDRFNADLNAVRACIQHVKKGGVLVLAPEGTRSKTAALQEARQGASFVAAKVNAPIVPVGLWGCEDSIFYANLRKLRRTTVTLRVGQPFTLPPLEHKDRDAALQAYTDEIMCRIAALLPPEYRGFYSEHPRLKEILTAEEETTHGYSRPA